MNDKTPKNNVISFEALIKAKAAQLDAADYESQTETGLNAIRSLDPKDASAIIEFLLNYVFMEVRAGLGIVEIPEGQEEPDIETLTIFNKIDDLYAEAAGGCYFCSKEVDPNEDEFGPETESCLMCKLKLGNFTEALGIPAGQVFGGMMRRDVQKKRILKNGGRPIGRIC